MAITGTCTIKNLMLKVNSKKTADDSLFSYFVHSVYTDQEDAELSRGV